MLSINNQSSGTLFRILFYFNTSNVINQLIVFAHIVVLIKQFQYIKCYQSTSFNNAGFYLPKSFQYIKCYQST